MTPTELATAACISVPYASQVLRSQRTPSLQMAFQIYDKTGKQFGPLANLTARDIETQRRLIEKAQAA